MYINQTTQTTSATTTSTSNTITEVKAALEKRGVDFAEMLVVIKEMRENIQQGRPADWSKEASNQQAAINEYLKQGETSGSEEDNLNSAQGMNRIRTSLAAQGFEPTEIDRYLAAMEMPETVGQSDGDISRQQQQHDAERLEQQQAQQIENRLTEPQQVAAFMLGVAPQRSVEGIAAQLSDLPAGADSARRAEPTGWQAQLLTPVAELPDEVATLDSLKDEILKLRTLLG